jgi:F-type H+-transporting ATPase subunit b
LENLGLNLGFLIVQILSFGIIFVTLRAWVYKPVLNMLAKRRQTIAQGLEDARIAQEARANAEEDASKVVADAHRKADEIMREANERANAVGKEVKTAAEADIVKMRQTARDEIEAERNRILSDLRSQVVALSMAAAQKLIGESLTQERQRALLQEFFSGVKSGKLAILEGGEAKGSSAEITSALPLTSQEQDMIKEDLLTTMEKSAVVTFHVDPKILGGLVVRVGDRVVDGSVAGQLQSLRQNLE